MDFPNKFTFSQPAQELVNTARMMTSGDMDLILGIRRLNFMQGLVIQKDESLFLAIRGIESETDDFPIGRIRDLCAVDYLERMDRKMDEYLIRFKQDILEICRNIIDLYGRHDG